MCRSDSVSHSCTLELLVPYAPCGKVMVKMAKVIKNYWIAKTVITGGTFVALMLQISKEDSVKKKKKKKWFMHCLEQNTEE